MNVEDVDAIAVLGAGSMGHGIAEVAALAGYEVTMRDIDEELVQAGYEDIEWSLDKLAEKDRITAEEAAAAKERVEPLVELSAAVADADVVIEAVPEQMEIKREVYEEVEEHAPERAIFATNTSSLSITELSEVTDRPERFCGMHFFNPPVRMALVEVIAGAHTSEETLETIEALAEAFEKEPVRVRKDSPGFLVNRVLVPLMNEGAWLVEEEVATVAEVDSTTKFDMGLPMGLFELADQVGIDVGYHVLEYLAETLGDAYEPCPWLAELVEDDRLGKKTGEGVYDYEDGGAEIPADEGRKDVADVLLGIMANEVGKLRAEDVAPVADIDRAMCLGAGFPDGPGRLADDAGLEGLIDALEERHEATGAARYAVSEGLSAAAEAGGFYDDEADEDAGASFESFRIEYPREHVAHLEIDRPHRLNTLGAEELDELEAALDQLESDEDVRAIALTGAGDRAFCAGADVQALAGSATPLTATRLSRRGQAVFGRLSTSSLPVVAGIDGYALGGGMELATCADLRIASERSEMGQTEHKLGLLPGWGGTQRLRAIVGEGRAKEIIFTAERYGPEELAEYGFINEVVANDALEERTLEMAAELAAGPPVAQELTKKAMHAGRDDTDAGLEVEAQAFGHLVGTDDLMEGVTAFLNDEEPEFEGK